MPCTTPPPHPGQPVAQCSDVVYFAVWATDKAGMPQARQRCWVAPRWMAAHNGTLLVIEPENADAVRRFVAEDPYLLAGVYATIEVGQWAWGLGQPKDSES